MQESHTIDVIGPSDSSTLRLWDEFMLTSPRGFFITLSSWLSSFAIYSVSFRIVMARDESGRILGGVALLNYGNRFIGWMISPVGPIVRPGYEHLAEELIAHTIQFALNSGTTMLQINVPQNDDIDSEILLTGFKRHGQRYLRPTPTPFGGGVKQLLWIEFPSEESDDAWSDKLLARFHKKTRKNIRYAIKNGVEVCECRTSDELQQAFAVIEDNGKRQGYATRSWKDVGPTIETQVQLNHATMHIARHEGRNIGALYGGTAGKRYQTVMQGTVRTKPDLKVGSILHWRAMEHARALNLIGCDLSSDGNPGIKAFKESFNPERVSFEAPLQFVFSSVRFRLLTRVLPWLRRNKKTIATVMSKLRGKRQ